MSESSASAYDVDEKISDPVSVTLQATIANEDTAFRDPEKTNRHSLFVAKILDIWDSQDGARRLETAPPLSRRLPDRLFDAYHREAGRGERLALRLLVTRPVMSGNLWAWHDDLQLPDHRQINYLPFIVEDIQDLIHRWDLPRQWPWLRINAREVGNFERKTEWDFSTYPARAIRMGIVIHFPFVLRPAKQEDFIDKKKGGKTVSRRNNKSSYNPWRDDPFIWSFAMSHSLRDGKTRGLLDGLTDYAFDDVSRRLLKAGAKWYQHPLHVPVVLLDIFFAHAAWEINRLCNDVSAFEDLEKNSEVQSLDEYDNITTRLQYMRRDFDFQKQLTKFLLETLTYLEEKIFDRQIGQGQNMSTYVEYVYETNPHMTEKLQNTLHLIENNLSTCDYLRSRAKDAYDFIAGKIQLKNNESSDRDADSNKTMSFLQMTFLPATFVAAILSINFFDFSKDPPTVYRSFWIFWVIALSLTVITLAVYFVAQQRKKIKDDEKQAQAKEAVEREQQQLVRPPSEGGSGDYDGGGKEGNRRSRRKEKPEAVV